MSYEWPDDDGFGDSKGWDRVSIGLVSRKPYRPKISRRDLLIPNVAGILRTLCLCSIGGLGMTVLYVAIPLLLVQIFLPLGRLYPALVAGAFPVLTAVLFLVAVWDDRRLRRLAKEL